MLFLNCKALKNDKVPTS